MLIYFAAPLFSQAERQFNQAQTEKLEQLGYQIFLPQRQA
jgi:nucleoside 2-deoxyribosyltransferase